MNSRQAASNSRIGVEILKSTDDVGVRIVGEMSEKIIIECIYPNKIS